MIRIA